jgi:hypothetical protein
MDKTASIMVPTVDADGGLVVSSAANLCRFDGTEEHR